MGAIMGGNVRVGLEDSIYLGQGQLAKSNAEQVSRIRGILEARSNLTGRGLSAQLRANRRATT